MITITELHVYPLKGGRGIARRELTLGRMGPDDDRRWMVVDGEGHLVTQREIGRLCLIGATPASGRLTLDAPGHHPLTVPTDPGAPRRRVRVWNDELDAEDQGDQAAQWLSDFLGASVRLVHFPDNATRRTDPDYDAVGAAVAFADGYPILIIGERSLEDLNRRLDTPLPMNRFRPNIVVTGSEPFAEDGWRRFRVGGQTFDVVKPCARCTVPTTDQATGDKGQEPLRTMARFRKMNSAVMFGMNVVHRGTGTIRVGDPVEVVEPG